MRLLELVRGEQTRPDIMQRLAAFSEQQLGKGVVHCADTPGFLANRVGCYAIQCALHEAFAAGLQPHIADAIFGRPMGFPKTGVFGLYDLIGIDLMSDVAKSLVNILPEGDAFHAVAQPIPLMVEMIARGQTGNKGGQGFYRQPKTGTRQVLDFASGEYVDFPRPDLPIALRAEQEGVRCLLDDGSDYGRYAWTVLSNTLVYAASLIPEVGNDPAAIDDAMKLGYNWVSGPFELMDEIGVKYLVSRLIQDGREVPDFLLQAANDAQDMCFYRVTKGQLQRRFWQADEGAAAPVWHTLDRGEGVNRFMETRRTLTPTTTNHVASAYDYQGVSLVEFHSKANALDGDSMQVLSDALDNVAAQGLQGLVVHNDAQHFSCGVNLETVRGFFRADDYDGLDAFLNDFQQTVHKMAVADFPVVAAPVGMSIGGGFEVVLHAQHVIAHANSVTGLVETGVGLIPGGGGCKEMLYRWADKLHLSHDNVADAAWKVFMALGYGTTATSPLQAKDMAMLRDSDQWLMNRDRMLNAALEHIAQATPIHHARPDIAMPGREVYHAMLEWLDKALYKGIILPHDVRVNTGLAQIITGGEIDAGTVWSEQDLYDAERRVFLELAQTEGTQARIN
ncbi:MAG: acetoacetyl-CoA reductase, partial [Rhodobacterales bacterium]